MSAEENTNGKKIEEIEDNENNENLESISLDYLYAGLVLRDDIFNHNGKLLLLAKGTVLTDTMIGRLKNFNDLHKDIRVSAELHKELIDKGLIQKIKQQHFENKTGYSEVKDEAVNLLTIMQVTKQVPYEQVCDLGSLVLERISISEPSALFQCINGNNEVDEYLFRHSANVAIINGLMGKWLGLSPNEIEELILLGIVHDIGKTKIPAAILESPNKLTAAEFEIIKKHPVYSAEMLNNNKKFSETVKNAALHHHERMNGDGYPDGLTAEDIPVYSRITAVSDVYDAMVSESYHKRAQSPFRVLHEMQTEQFSGLDIRFVKLFIEQMPKELIGKTVLMSNGTLGIVRYIEEQNIEYPLVEINGEVIITDKNLYCVSMAAGD